VHLVYLSKAISKRVSKVDDNEDVFEADDMVQWEGGWTLQVEARRRGRGDSQVCPRGSLTYASWPSSAHQRAVHLWRRVRGWQTFGYILLHTQIPHS